MPTYSLDEWRRVMRGEVPQPSDDYIVIAFPNDEIRSAFLSRISEWGEMEVRTILGNMLGDSQGFDIIDRIHVDALRRTGPVRALDPDAPEARHFCEYDRRAILAGAGKSNEPVWPGISWALDLLPNSPRDALSVASAYFIAHCQYLPDWRLAGLSDAMSLIRHRYITQGHTERERKIRVLRSLDPREMEFLFASLYRAMGYDVMITPKQKDGGKDVVAEREGEKVYVECKNWGQRVDVGTVRSFGFTVLDKGVTWGVLISASGFTEKGPETASELVRESSLRYRLRLLDGHAAVQQLNEHLGVGWHLRVDQIIAQEKSTYGATM